MLGKNLDFLIVFHVLVFACCQGMQQNEELVHFVLVQIVFFAAKVFEFFSQVLGPVFMPRLQITFVFIVENVEYDSEEYIHNQE